MRYSYIKQRKKTAFTPKMQTVFIVFDIVIFVLFALYMFFFFEDYRFSKQIQHTNMELVKLKTQIDTIDGEIQQIKKYSEFCEKISTKNIVLKDSIKNLIDLVPPQITLLEALMLDDTLIVQGITPSKYVYESMLQAPLDSIYIRSKNTIYPLKNNYFKFTSTNYMNKQKGAKR